MIKLGDKVKDSLTGLKGIATGRSEFLYGCVRILIEPQELKDGVPVTGTWIDEQRVELIKEEKPTMSPQSEATSGGPQHDYPR